MSMDTLHKDDRGMQAGMLQKLLRLCGYDHLP